MKTPLLVEKDKSRKQIPCKGRWVRSSISCHFICDYPNPPYCEDCLAGGGEVDPRFMCVKKEE